MKPLLKSISLSAALLLLMGNFESCKHQRDPYADVDGSGRTICFESEVLPLFQSYCASAGCHGNGSSAEGVSLDSYAHITAGDNIVPNRLYDSKVFDAMTGGGEEAMPPGGRPQLTEEQIRLIGTWIMQGAENTTNCDTACDSSIYTFSAVIAPMMQQHCTGCHGGSVPSGGINLTNWSGVHAAAIDGSLLGSVNHAGGYEPMPQGTSKLSDCRISQISNWINAGAQDN